MAADKVIREREWFEKKLWIFMVVSMVIGMALYYPILVLILMVLDWAVE